MEALRLYDNAVDISREEAVRIIECAPDSAFRRRPSEPSRWNDPPDNFPLDLIEEIFHEGAWLHFCRTDECDDVCTSHCVPYEKFKDRDTRKFWLKYAKKCSLGARIGPERFALIDALTDG